MRLNCPHCQNALNIVDAELAAEASCPSCGSQFPLLSATLKYSASTKQKGQRIGRFDLIEQVGIGQFGAVWKARDTQLDRIVAVKLPRNTELSAQRRSFFMREARAAAGIKHPHIVQVHEIGEEGEQVFIVSQFIDGVTLRDKLIESRYSPDAAARMMVTIADAIHHAHESGVVHRDLKPSNILIDTAGEPHISDFGLAKVESAEVTVTVTGVILGTPAYMSPEQARGNSHAADRRTDVYSLGVILYEMLTGQRPFDGSTTLLLHQIQSQDPRAPRTINRMIPRDLETIVLKTLNKDPERRYQTAGAMSEDLQRFLRGESIVARRASRVERGLRWIRRNQTLSAALVVAVLATSTAIGVKVKSLNAKDTISQLEQQGLKVEVTDRVPVRISTDPPGAKLTLYPLNAITGEPITTAAEHPRVRTPAAVSLLPNDYLVVAVLDDGRFHEVYRHVPRNQEVKPLVQNHLRWKREDDGRLALPTIKIPNADVTDGMSSFDGNQDFEAGLPESSVPVHSVRVDPFYLDTTEVTFDSYRKAFFGQLPATLPNRTREDVVPLEHPAHHVLYDDAVYIAELMGKRLPTEYEYEFAATNGGKTLYPWGNDPPRDDAWTEQNAGQPDWDRTLSEPAVFGLFSNVGELTSSRYLPFAIKQPVDVASLPASLINSSGTEVTVRGRNRLGIDNEVRSPELGARFRSNFARMRVSANVGFRCARSKTPRQ